MKSHLAENSQHAWTLPLSVAFAASALIVATPVCFAAGGDQGGDGATRAQATQQTAPTRTHGKAKSGASSSSDATAPPDTSTGLMHAQDLDETNGKSSSTPTNAPGAARDNRTH